MVKIGNTSFREETIKKMSLKQFKDIYKEKLKGQDLDEVYNTLTGKDNNLNKEDTPQKSK